MKRSDLFVVIQTVTGRQRALADTLRSLADSDLGAPDAIECAPPEENIRVTFLRTLMAIERSGRSWGLRLEDDVIANVHAFENIASWPAIEEPDFGAGWLFISGISAKMIHFARRVPKAEITGGQANLIPNPPAVSAIGYSSLQQLAHDVGRVWNDCQGQQDRALARAVFESGKRVFVHYPPLFEHNIAHPSTLAPDRPNMRGIHDTGGLFSRVWQRGEQT
jgi:hypothetical protein